MDFSLAETQRHSLARSATLAAAILISVSFTDPHLSLQHIFQCADFSCTRTNSTEGGEYRISRPLRIPEMNANLQFGRGSLVADPTWNPGEDPNFLFIIGNAGGCKCVQLSKQFAPAFNMMCRLSNGASACNCRVPQGSCNIDINFPELFIDGAKRASGIQINDVMGVTIGPGG